MSRICGVVAPNSGPNGEPLACAWDPDHLPESPHSWASLPTWPPRADDLRGYFQGWSDAKAGRQYGEGRGQTGSDSE